MIGLVLVTHGRLAYELRLAMEHVVGPQRGVATICINADDDVEKRRHDIERCIDEVNAGDGVILLTDMFGGTPSNLAISMMDRGGVEVIAGVNLPMLVKLAKTRSHQTLAECVGSAELAGRKYIAAASRVLTSCSPPNTCRSLDPRQALGAAQELNRTMPLKADAPRPFVPAALASSYKAGS
jgi:PTS system mannose-specific IIA component